MTNDPPNKTFWMPLMDTGLAINSSLLDERQAVLNHSQTLHRLAERGGLSPYEASCLIERKSLQRPFKDLKASMEVVVAAKPGQPGKADEPIALADEYGSVVGHVAKGKFNWVDDWHMAAHLFLFKGNSIVVTKRARTKKLLAGCWTFAVSGTMSAGETAEQCVVRETEEELGICIKPESSGFHIPTVIYNTLKCHDYIFTAHSDADLSPDPRETDDLMFVPDIRKLVEILDSGYLSPVTPGFLNFTKHLADKNGIRWP